MPIKVFLVATFIIFPAISFADALNLPDFQQAQNLSFKDDTDIESIYQNMLLVVLSFLGALFFGVVANKKYGFMNSLTKKVSGNSRIVLVEVKRISAKTVVYVVAINGQEKVLIESTANTSILNRTKISSMYEVQADK